MASDISQRSSSSSRTSEVDEDGVSVKHVFCNSCWKVCKVQQFCHHCSIDVCKKCLEKHQNEMKMLVSSTIEKVNKGKKNLEDSQVELDEISSDVNSKFSKVCEEVAGILLSKVDECRDNFKSKIDAKVVPKQDELRQRMSQTERLRQSLEGGEEQLQTWGTDADADAELYRRCEKMNLGVLAYEKLSAKDVPEYTCNWDRIPVTSIEYLDKLFTVSVKQSRLYSKIKKVDYSVDFDGMTYIARMVITPTDDVVIVTGNCGPPRIFYQFDINGRSLRMHPAEKTEDAKISGLAAGEKGLYLCTGSDVFSYDYDFNYIGKFETPANVSHWSLAANVKEDTVFVLSTGKRVTVYSGNGKQLRTFGVGDGNEISLAPNKDVLIYGKIGNPVVHRYTSIGGKLGSVLLQPHPDCEKLISDAHATMMGVIDASEAYQVQIFAPNGKLIRRIPLAGADWPAGVGFHSSGAIIIGSSNGKLYFL